MPCARVTVDDGIVSSGSPIAAHHSDTYGVFVDGHTDQTGADAYNRDLSERRANAVVAYLVRKGVAIERLTPRGFGETRPLDADGAGPENRRVESSLSQRVE